MKHAGLRLAIVVWAGALGVCALASCSSDVPGAGDAGSADSAAPDSAPLEAAAPDVAVADADRPDAAVNVAGLPPRPTAPTTATSAGYYAIHTMFLGDTDRAGAPSQTAWKRYGYDLDSRVSTDKSTDHCRLRPGAPNKVKTDGESGIDNSFGANILPIFTTALPDFPRDTNAALQTGTGTYILQAVGFDGTSDQSNTGLTGQLFETGRVSPAPRWDGSDLWPVLASSLVGGTLAGGANAKMSDAYVSGGMFVGVLPGTFNLSLAGVQGGIVLPIERPLITFKKPSNGLDATTGTIAGVMNTARFNSEFRRVAGQLSTVLCEGSTLDNITSQFTQASDIMSDGTNGDSSKECDAISIAIGFTAKVVKEPSAVAPAPPPSPDPCVPARDAGGGG
ncbi:MAG: hypothetical protein IPQ09_15895 [Myxococcales bacterium]|nr:hypothetical protein [Myxococcales bacterium]